MKITILGSGTSQGVPVITCDCEVCKSTSDFDKRLRSSIMLTIDRKNYVIDTGPDFRQQMLRENVQNLEGVIFTHEHKDHIAGLDDVRAFNYKTKKDVEVYCSENVEMALRREFYYVFENQSYPGVPKLNLNRIENTSFKTKEGDVFLPIEVMHYKMQVFGFRIHDFTYITDAKTISDVEREKIKGSKVLIINCLHEMEHISHLNLKEVLLLIEELKPEKTYLTHISHYFGKHEDIKKKLPENVSPAFDGMCFEV